MLGPQLLTVAYCAVSYARTRGTFIVDGSRGFSVICLWRREEWDGTAYTPRR